MKKYQQHTILQYLEVLSQKTPVPGGGSAAALTAAMGAALLSMCARYSLGRGSAAAIERKISGLLKTSEAMRRRFAELVDLDAQAYLGVVRAGKAGRIQKQKARRQANRVPREICRLCYKAAQAAEGIAENGNKNLASDVRIAAELFLAAFQSAACLIRMNQEEI